MVYLNCLNCGSVVTKSEAEYKRRPNTYCSLSCFGAHRTKQNLEMFYERVEKIGDCMEWQGVLNKHGYGVIKKSGHNKLAHRISYELSVGEIPEGMNVCHKCDNKKCVNPKHLFISDQSGNMADMTKKRRKPSKLTWEIVQYCKIRNKVDGVSTEKLKHEIKLKFGIDVNRRTISYALSNRTFKHKPSNA